MVNLKQASLFPLTKPPQSYLRDWIYGGIDGTVTTFAVVSGVAGGKLSYVVVLILGFANLLADGFSMAASNFLGTKSEIEQYQRYKKIETTRIENSPIPEINELRQIFRNKGLEGEVLEKVVDSLTANQSLWVDTILQEKFGLPLLIRSPYKAAFYTFLSFVIFGLIPLLPYVFFFPSPFFWSCVLTGMVFFGIGSGKSYWSIHSWLYSGIETLIIGALTATLAYLIGLLIHFLIMT